VVDNPTATPGPESLPAPACSTNGLTKTFAGGRALDAVDLDVIQGEVHALLGENGSGKSTFIKILSGYHRPDPGGTVLIGGRELVFGRPASSYELGARFVHQDLGLVEAASISDNLAFGPGFPTRLGTIKGRAARADALAALDVVELDVDPDLPISSLSPAQKTGVAVARSLRTDDGSNISLLVLDEPTARLPEEEVENLIGIVRSVARRGIGVLYVTHRLDEVFEIASTASVLRDGRKVSSEPVSGLTRERLIGQLLGDALEVPHRLKAHKVGAGDPVLTVTDIRSESLREVSLQVAPGEIVGIAGITGSGREALCATVFGARARDAGEVRIQGADLPAKRPDLAIGRGVAYIPAERKTEGSFVDLSARENIAISSLGRFWKAPLIRRKAETSAARNWFDRFDVRPRDRINAPLSSFSGGNQQKVVFGKWFERQPALFLLDEPTQGVDVGAKAQLHEALFEAAANGAAILLSSSDTEELVTICDRVLVLRSGRVTSALSGGRLTPHDLSRATLGIDDDPQEGALS
jgi:ribose transport system ATP-binding protein